MKHPKFLSVKSIETVIERSIIRFFIFFLLVGLSLVAIGDSAYDVADLGYDEDLDKLLGTGSCASCDLSKVNLVEAKLAGASLTGADLTGASLNRANLFGANQKGADLTKVNLTGAKLIEADLTSANLSNADLSGAKMTAAVLTGVDLTGANMNRTELDIETLVRFSLGDDYDSLPQGLKDQIESRKKVIASTPGFKDLKPGLTRNEMRLMKVCFPELSPDNSSTCYDMDNMKFQGIYDYAEF